MFGRNRFTVTVSEWAGYLNRRGFVWVECSGGSVRVPVIVSDVLVSRRDGVRLVVLASGECAGVMTVSAGDLIG